MRTKLLRLAAAGVIAATVLPAVALATAGPTAKLARTHGNGLKLVMHWSAGIDYFDFTLVKHKGQKIANVTNGCYAQGSVVSCTTSGQKSFSVQFTVTPRYKSRQRNKLSIGHRTTTKTVAVIGP